MNFEFECNECGSTLDVDVQERCGDITLYVSPCESCRKETESNSYDEGYESGREDGFDEGRDEGYTQGYQLGYDEGLEASGCDG